MTCLIERTDKVKSESCKAQLWKKTKQRVENVKLDSEAHEVCQYDVDTHCQEAKSGGHGMVQKCLQSKLNELSGECRYKVKFYLVLASEDMRFKEDLAKACKASIKKVCP